MARKTYLNQDVYQAAKARLEFIFDEFQHIYFSFSGGKDSGVMMELALEVARERAGEVQSYLSFRAPQ